MRNSYPVESIKKSERITRLVSHLYAKLPEIESARALLLTESYQQTEGEPIVIRRAKAFAHILDHIPIIIRPWRREAVRRIRSFPMSGWRQSLIR